MDSAIINFADRIFGSGASENVPEDYILLAEDFSIPAGLMDTTPERKFGFV